jgi:hypothetical protein
MTSRCFEWLVHSMPTIIIIKLTNVLGWPTKSDSVMMLRPKVEQDRFTPS